MFRFHKTRDIITLFHKANSPASTRVLNFLKQTSAQASETATEDQASDHTSQNKIQRSDFDLEVVETPPTKDQLKSILEYAGGSFGKFVKGATNEMDAMKKVESSPDNFQWPVVVDWNNGKAVAGENEKAITDMINGTQ